MFHNNNYKVHNIPHCTMSYIRVQLGSIIPCLGSSQENFGIAGGMVLVEEGPEENTIIEDSMLK